MTKTAGYWQAIDNMVYYIYANFEKHVGDMTDKAAMLDKLMTDPVVRGGYDKVMNDIANVVSNTYGIDIQEVQQDACNKATQTVFEKVLNTK